jgi:hypothetical protein
MKISGELAVSFFKVGFSALKVEVESSTEMLNTYQRTQHRSPEYHHLNIHHSGHLKFHPMNIVIEDIH